MLPYILIAIIVVPFIYFFIIRKEQKRRQAIATAFPVYHPASAVNVWETKLAGIRYQCTKDDIGVVVFAVKPEKDNPYDQQAMAVIRDDGKMLGYIEKSELKTYNEWSRGEVCMGIGQINYYEERNKLWGNLIIFGPDVDETETEGEIRRYLDWATEHYGADYIPERYK